MRAHIVENGVIINTIVVDVLVDGMLDAELGGSIGDTWDGENFTQPVPVVVVPEFITPRQGKIILSRYGLYSTVQTAIDGMTGQAGEEARIEFEYAQEWRRDWPLLNTLAVALNLTSEQIDQMFIEAATI